jgi:chemotaxis protein methyltransferase CheR
MDSVDVIFCRNVLIYLSAKQMQRIAAKLSRCLAPGGWLFVGAAEASGPLFPDLVSVHFPGVIAYRRPDGEGALPSACSVRTTVSAEPSRPAHLDPPYSVAALPLAAETAVSSIAEPAQTTGGTFVPQTGTDQRAPDAPEPNAAGHEARARADRGELSAALEWCDRAIAADKLDPRFQYLRATILQELGRAAEAAASLRRAIYLDADFVMAHFALAHLLAGQGRLEDAARHFDHVRRLLRKYPADQTLPESGGITAGRLAQIVTSLRAPEMAT